MGFIRIQTDEIVSTMNHCQKEMSLICISFHFLRLFLTVLKRLAPSNTHTGKKWPTPTWIKNLCLSIFCVSFSSIFGKRKEWNGGKKGNSHANKRSSICCLPNRIRRRAEERTSKTKQNKKYREPLTAKPEWCFKLRWVDYKRYFRKNWENNSQLFPEKRINRKCDAINITLPIGLLFWADDTHGAVYNGIFIIQKFETKPRWNTHTE